MSDDFSEQFYLSADYYTRDTYRPVRFGAAAWGFVLNGQWSAFARRWLDVRRRARSEELR